ncbi:rhs element Vgr family protein, partial [Vibrio cholerae O1 str. 116063]
HNLNRKSMAQ